MAKIDIDKLVADLLYIYCDRRGIDRDMVQTYLDDALNCQGLACRDGEIVEHDGKFWEQKENFTRWYNYGYTVAVDKACEFLGDNFVLTGDALKSFKRTMLEKRYTEDKEDKL